MSTSRTLLSLLALALLSSVSAAMAQSGSAFTYQGRLREGAVLANGNYEMQFRLYPVLSGGVPDALYDPSGPVPISNGLFTLEVDFGQVFLGTPRFLEIAVRHPGEPAFVVLNPRQRVTPAPGAQYAQLAAVADTNAVDSDAIVDAAVTANDLATDSVAGAEIVDGSVTAAEIADATVSSADIAPGAVQAANIADNSVASAQIVDGSVSFTDIANNSIRATTIQADAVLGSHILDGTISTDDIGAGAVQSNQLASGAVGNSHIATGAVGAGNLANNSVLSTNIATGAVGSGHIADGAIGAQHITDDAVGSTEIAADGVRSDEIAPNSVASSELSTDAVLADEIAANAVGADEIAASAVGSDEIATNAVGADEIGVGAVGDTEINASFVQRRVSGNCVAGSSIASISQLGTVTCETSGARASGALFAQGTASAPTIALAFIAARVTLGVQSGQKVLVVSHAGLGSTAAGGASALELYICSRQTPAGPVTNVGGGLFGLTAAQNQRHAFGLSQILTMSTTGTFEFGLCGLAPAPAAWNNNEWSYTNALVLP